MRENGGLNFYRNLMNTLIMVNASGDKRTMLPLTAVTSGLIWVAIVFLSVMNLRQAGNWSETEKIEVPGAEDTESVERKKGTDGY